MEANWYLALMVALGSAAGVFVGLMLTFAIVYIVLDREIRKEDTRKRSAKEYENQIRDLEQSYNSLRESYEDVTEHRRALELRCDSLAARVVELNEQVESTQNPMPGENGKPLVTVYDRINET